MIRIEIPFEPIPAARPRFSSGGVYFDKQGKPHVKSRVYQPAKNAEYRRKVQTAARLAMNGKEPLTGELKADIKIYRKYKRTAKIYGDCDNHEKAIFDGLNGIVFVDDSQICRVVVEKFTDKERPRVEIEIANLC